MGKELSSGGVHLLKVAAIQPSYNKRFDYIMDRTYALKRGF